ncbi:hypothetical protein EG327_006114 [Venturia inaequalis]|uniref:Chaplin domain-containing protein n=1 Tax=Venturia inaequalis TaxID=5025 RepID=A0A8H3Z3C8_VENIN|nr:hypothetical protein EG327_006114 [Venturia inaequalis]
MHPASIFSLAALSTIISATPTLLPRAIDTNIIISSPALLSGNQIQVPVHVPVNLCGNTVDIIGLLNPAFGNTCVNSKVRRDLLLSVQVTVSVILEGGDWVFSVPVGVPFEACGEGFDGSAVAEEMRVGCGVGQGLNIG